ncbi:hypothetical protein GCK32_018656, partial [Trichostrongylus colubriformis]
GFCNYDGTHRHVLAHKIGHDLYGLDVFADFLYFSDYSKGTIERVHKFTGGNRSTVIAGLSHPKGIQIVHPEKWPKKGSGNPCESNSTCAHLCVPSNTRQGYQCLCRDGMRYDDGECVFLSRPSTGSHDIVSVDGGIENPVFEPCEDTPMEPEMEDELAG